MQPIRKPSKTNDKPENGLANQDLMYFQILLEEYKSTRNSSLELESKLNTLKSVSVGIFTALIAIQKSSAAIEVPTPIFLLITSVIFNSLSMAIAHTISIIMTLADYEYEHLKPQLQELINRDKTGKELEVLNWQSYYIEPLNKRHTVGKYLFVSQSIGGFIFPVFMSISPLIYAIHLFFERGTSLQLNESLILILDIAFTFIMLIMLGYQPLIRYLKARTVCDRQNGSSSIARHSRETS